MLTSAKCALCQYDNRTTYSLRVQDDLTDAEAIQAKNGNGLMVYNICAWTSRSALTLNYDRTPRISSDDRKTKMSTPLKNPGENFHNGSLLTDVTEIRLARALFWWAAMIQCGLNLLGLPEALVIKRAIKRKRSFWIILDKLLFFGDGQRMMKTMFSIICLHGQTLIPYRPQNDMVTMIILCFHCHYSPGSDKRISILDRTSI